jgi:CHRD domain
MRRVRHLTVAAAAAIGAVAIGDASAVDADFGVRGLATVMTGAAERPGPGDPDGFGFAGLLVNPGRGRICYALAVRHIALATAAHIHVGAEDVAGPVVVGLDAPNARGFSANCANVDPALAAAIAETPANYYVNVHTADFPAGAVRGQLG